MVSFDNCQERQIKLAVVGDVHDQWEPADGEALKHLGVDVVLFVGDFGNEAVPVVREIALLDFPKAVILGNHDAWYSATDWGRSRCPYNRQQEDWVQQQLDLLGDTHVGYGKLDFPEWGFSVVGGRPFSWGGPEWKYTSFYRRFGVDSFESSTTRILNAVEQAGCETVIFLGHNGPTGLGEAAEDPCGKDWEPRGGDFGDPDLEKAITKTYQLGKKIPLVTFGHMHHQLRHLKKELRRVVHCNEQGTIYLNAASVPRIVKTANQCRRNFSIVSLQNDKVTEISLVWVDQNLQVVAEQCLYEAEAVAKPVV